MDIKEVFQKRYSCRSYQGKSVPEEKLKSILEAAQLAPSAHNRQSYKFIVIRDREKREKLAEAAGQGFIAQAPIVIAGVALEPEEVLRSGVPAYAVDLGIAMEHIALQATAEGLGTCWIGAFSQEKAKEILGVPKEYKIVALMPVGYAADFSRPKGKKNLEELVSYQ